MQLTLQLGPIAWSPARPRAFDMDIAPGEITLNLREIDWHPSPKVSASIEVLEGDDAEREYAYCVAGGAP